MSNPDPLIEACALSKRYKNHQALDDVSLSIAPGSVLGLLGRNGAGKSTLIECLLGLRQADSGEARLFGKAATQIDDQDKATLAYVPQHSDSLQWMKVADALSFCANLYPNWDNDLATNLLQRWGLDGQRLIQNLSPGQRQQVAIIRALAPRPRLLVLDEPAASLDPLARRELLREIVELASEQGSTVVFSTHILSDLERIASHVALIHQGRVRLHAETDQLKDELRRVQWPQHCPLPAGPLPGEVARRSLPDGGWSLVLNLAQGETRSLLPEQASLHRLGLEDLMLELAA
ncbi:ABC transporter ATP-binding protein [Pseudomonas alkylphenolica]|uniref:ABC transporter ATP-binding protein n=1 Tax=Pseudomonas alkylphenolica TaxID=237609 RepID=UPI0018D7DF2B|nr:ABC transporter ATP-binding protein [Pseudomonas alkylphenolica]MBH3428186.1 ABC transporter ATP-binding protein [Pseudomonas alkylphenolica]